MFLKPLPQAGRRVCVLPTLHLSQCVQSTHNNGQTSFEDYVGVSLGNVLATSSRTPLHPTTPWCLSCVLCAGCHLPNRGHLGCSSTLPRLPCIRPATSVCPAIRGRHQAGAVEATHHPGYPLPSGSHGASGTHVTKVSSACSNPGSRCCDPCSRRRRRAVALANARYLQWTEVYYKSCPV
jgi:hypothetical protein